MTGIVAFGTLDLNDFGLGTDGSLNGFDIGIAVFFQRYDLVGHAVLGQTSLFFTDAHYALHGIVGGAHGEQDLIAGTQDTKHGGSQCMSTGNDLRTYQRILSMENAGIYTL